MGVTKTILRSGNGVDRPTKGDEVIIDYRGCLYDPSRSTYHNMGKQFDSSQDRGEFKTPIGIGKVIRGWDEGVMNMTVGEKCILTISGDYAYGDRGFPGLIPPNSTLVFEVELKGISRRS
ncbi:hypothetical protein H105_03038 [Trichophyton soudanense CBS 452.61]|uniref:peptidylprolyl isomerase n=1 Tax=Trichophyton soudanense CBS 452.61 TaxID=1215331 RepID=A0A022XXK6_TRISD|nr:hypothetical protein H102_03019 [Trichophyton rubrum CBS 100081]EZF75457.1 hypothetical protein H105_03038 [Trichophyton soudanense CBS 452.61]